MSIVKAMSTDAALVLVARERERQETLWPRDAHPLIAQYAFYAPHLVLLKRYIDRAIEKWTVSETESDIQAELVKIAAIAVRALEEITVIEAA